MGRLLLLVINELTADLRLTPAGDSEGSSSSMYDWLN